MSTLIRVTLSAQSLKLQPGEKAELTLMVQNFSDIVDRYKLSVEGVEPTWVTLSRGELSLFPQDQDQVRLTLVPPAGSDARAGTYDLSVHVTSQENPSERTTTPLTLEVAPLTAFEVTLRPQMQSGLKQGVFTLHLSNAGNSDMAVGLAASDPEEGCIYTLNPVRTLLPAGQERLVQLTVRPKVPRAPEGGKVYAFTVTARPEELPQQTRQVQGQWQQLGPRRRSRWPVIAGILAGLAAIAVVALLLLRPYLAPLLFPTPTPTATPTPTPTLTPTPTALPTWTVPPTYTPLFTGTPLPTYTAPPTYTPFPGATPVATRTPTIFIPPIVSLKPILPPIPLPTLAVRYDLLAQAAAARWINDEGDVLSFGKADDERGFALYRENALLEDGNRYARALEMHPRWVDNGGIQGDFSTLPYLVGSGDELVVSAGFLSGATRTSGARFRVLLVPAEGRQVILYDAVDTYDGKLLTARLSLERYVKQRVTFLLQVQANGSSQQDWATWTVLRIERP